MLALGAKPESESLKTLNFILLGAWPKNSTTNNTVILGCQIIFLSTSSLVVIHKNNLTRNKIIESYFFFSVYILFENDTLVKRNVLIISTNRP